MARKARIVQPDSWYHVMSRGNNRMKIFHDAADYEFFIKCLSVMRPGLPSVRIIAYCLMPNHFHLAMWAAEGRHLSAWMQRLLSVYAMYHHRKYGTSGHLWGGRFKSFPVQSDQHLLTVMRYVDANPVAAGLVEHAQEWPYSSVSALNETRAITLATEPVERGPRWLEFVHDRSHSPTIELLRAHVRTGKPYGSDAWQTSFQLRREADALSHSVALNTPDAAEMSSTG